MLEQAKRVAATSGKTTVKEKKKLCQSLFIRRYNHENLDNTEDGALYRLPLLFSCLCEACAQEPVVGYGRHPYSLIGRPIDGI
jgi:hypothetical protein